MSWRGLAVVVCALLVLRVPRVARAGLRVAGIELQVETGCPAPGQVEAALAQRLRERLDPGPRWLLVLRPHAGELALRLYPDPPAAAGLDARHGSAPDEAGALLVRSLPANESACAALADTVALIVARYLDELAVRAADPGTPPARAVDPLKPKASLEVRAEPARDDGTRAVEPTTVGGAAGASEKGRARSALELALFVALRPGRVAAAAPVLGLGLRLQRARWFGELQGAWVAAERLRWQPGPGASALGTGALDALTLAAWAGLRWRPEPGRAVALALDGFAWAQVDLLSLDVPRAGRPVSRYQGWEPALGTGATVQVAPLPGLPRLFVRTTLCAGVVLDRHEFRAGATAGAPVADSPRLHVSLGLALGASL